jgi:predicted HicB family RNase H-like nuclease
MNKGKLVKQNRSKPKAKAVKDTILKMRVTSEMHTLLMLEAEARNMTFSSYARHLLTKDLDVT